METEASISIAADTDIVLARQEGRRLAAQLGFCASDLTLIAVAISEVARNILEYAREGQVVIRLIERRGAQGVAVTASDDGPGIPDVALALEDGFSTSGGLGLGLPGARRLMDEFEIHSAIGKGTTITMRKWAR